jgi:hypothetical protein
MRVVACRESMFIRVNPCLLLFSMRSVRRTVGPAVLRLPPGVVRQPLCLGGEDLCGTKPIPRAEENQERANWVRLSKAGGTAVPATSIAAVRSEKRVRSPAFGRLQDRVNAELRTEKAGTGARVRNEANWGELHVGSWKWQVGRTLRNEANFTGGREPGNGRLGSFVQTLLRGQMGRIVLIMTPLFDGRSKFCEVSLR